MVFTVLRAHKTQHLTSTLQPVYSSSMSSGAGRGPPCLQPAQSAAWHWHALSLPWLLRLLQPDPLQAWRPLPSPARYSQSLGYMCNAN